MNRLKLLTILSLLINFSIAQNSVLNTGNWYKIGVTEEGIYRLTYSDLVSLGINLSGIDPHHIRIYGNGGGMLPELNAEPRPNDLQEIAIKVQGEGDNSFDPGDYILFYGQSQHRWHYDSSDQHFHHEINIYSDTTFYFITTDLGLGKRIASQASSLQTPNFTPTTFDDYAFYEPEQVNFIHSGREWYGDRFDDSITTRTYSFTFPNLVVTGPVFLETSVAARSITQTSQFEVSANGQAAYSLSLSRVTGDPIDPYATSMSNATGLTLTSSQIDVSCNFMNPSPNAQGWLDYIELNVKRHLSISGSQMFFRNTDSIGAGKVTEFMITNANSNHLIWDVTDHQNVKNQDMSLSGDTIRFSIETDSLKEFVVFDGSSFLTPTLYGSIPNQNLHGIGATEMLIVTAPEFVSAANNLANYHRNTDGLTVKVVTTGEIYNEFSSGAQDLFAIRDFVKMVYDKAQPSDSLKYLLLFGDASYDYKNRTTGNTNFVPAFESENSLSPISSYATDDFFGFLENSEGSGGFGDDMDIGIGRLPVKSLAEANSVVNKIIHYHSSQALGKWRKEMAFIGDDEDANIYLNDANDLATFVDQTYCDYNVTKIFLDAYPQILDTFGARYPAVKSAILNRINNGALLVNYNGYGSESLWAHEHVLELADINALDNTDKLPMFFSASSEDARFDDPAVNTIGENLMLKPDGGAVAFVGTCRIIYASANFASDNIFIHHLLELYQYEMPRLGDLMKMMKHALTGNDSYKKIILIGDPAVRLAYPENNVVTQTVNGQPIPIQPDSFFAGSTIMIEGEIQDQNGMLLSGFNGKLYVDLFDKQQTDTTLGNDPSSVVTPFSQWRNPVLSDSVNVQNGAFSISLTIPAGVDSTFGFGKISFYASDGTSDAGGCYNNFLIGGGDQSITTIEVLSDDIEFLIYPSPVIGHATVEIKGFVPKDAVFSLYDDIGREVKKLEAINSNKFSFSTENLAAGVYLFSFRDNKQHFYKSGKLMIR